MSESTAKLIWRRGNLQDGSMEFPKERRAFRRIIEITQPLDSVSLRKRGKVRGSFEFEETYKLPTVNMNPTPIFFFMLIFNLVRTGNGRAMMMRSCAMLMPPFAYASALTLRHWPCRSLSQK